MRTKLVLTSVCLSALAGAVLSLPARAEVVFKPILDSNIRFETVEQDGFAQKAEGLTVRNRLGVETTKWKNLSFLVELENTTALIEDYNSNLNGKTAYPSIGDPEVTDLNRAQIAWAPSKDLTLTVGRQMVMLDDGRFVGNSNWRQDNQTLDAVRMDFSQGKFKATGLYIARVNRTPANEKDWNSNSYGVNASYEFSPAAKLTGFAYALRFTSDAKAPTNTDRANARASSVAISGLRLSGGRTVSDVKLGYVAQYAVERDGHGNPNDFQLEEKMLEVNAAYKWLSGRVNFESLGGNGTVGFVTPIATAHQFQGFADAFSATGGHKTFVNGLNDLGYTVTLSVPGRFKPTFSLIYHDYSTTRLDRRLGSEWNAMATFALTKTIGLTLKHADFGRDHPSAPASRTKTWLMLTYKL